MTFWKRQNSKDGKQMSVSEGLRVGGGADFKGTVGAGLGRSEGFCVVTLGWMHDSIMSKPRMNFTEDKLKW